MKFVHAADLHLDSPLRGLASYEGAPVERVRGATRRALHNLIDLCLHEQAAFLLLAGDIFDGDWRDFNTGLYFVKELSRLRDAGIAVFMVRGNHDAASEVTRQLTLPSHVHEFADDHAGSVVLEQHGVAVHGLSFTRRAMPHSLVPRYPAPVAGALNIGVLHTSADGRPNHGTYAPCHVDELVAKGYDYWALGHVHAHEILHRAPHIVFPGNTQGRHIKESGAKGCVVVRVEAGAVGEVRHVPLDVMRWSLVEVTLAADDGVDELRERAQRALAQARASADGRLLAARLVVRGGARAHEAVQARREAVVGQLRADAFEWQDDVWLGDIELHTRPLLPLDELGKSEGFVGELLRSLAAARGGDAAEAIDLERELQPLIDKLGDELGQSGIELADLAPLFDEAEARLAAALVTPSERER
jgi:DNA repair exonuclease SbcCD nuclease subunit